MRILLWHGYLLKGSGSNIYAANIARSWRRRGHDVLLMCQERGADDLDFVDAHGDFNESNRSFEVVATGAAPAPGRVRVVRPAIGPVLPVYVYDAYEGFEAKRFVDLDDAELARYTQTNIAALVAAISDFRPEAIITGHEVMGPYIARRACEQTGTTYIAKLHGSALEYAVKLQDRYKHYAAEGLRGARVVTGGSRYMVAEAASVITGWVDKAAVVNPGCDVELFRPPTGPREGAATVGYVGKFIVSKGVHNFLAALGLTRGEQLRAVVVGYGGFEQELHQIWDALKARDRPRLESMARAGDGRPLTHLEAFLGSPGAEDGFFDRIAEIPLEFTGRLDHGPLSAVLPTFDVLVIPSVLAEAFGMVAAEAAACAVFPVVPRHSGIGEVGAAIEDHLQEPGLLTYDPDDPIRGIAAAIDRVLSIPGSKRAEMGHAAATLARERWSWDTVADNLLAHAAT